MKSSIEYLDEAKKTQGFDSDNKMALWLGVKRQTISMWRKGPQIMDDYAAAKIAEALGIDALEVIAAANAEREKDEKRKSYWVQIGARTAAEGAAAVFFILEINNLQSKKSDTAHVMRN